VEVIAIAARSVGVARARRAEHALGGGAAWIAFTDADSRVAADWLAVQRGLEAGAVCGTLQVDDWSALGVGVAPRYGSGYVDCDGHRHVHWANLGVSAHAYASVGGMPPQCEHEDSRVRKAVDRPRP
jgi:hypothetical protein